MHDELTFRESPVCIHFVVDRTNAGLPVDTECTVARPGALAARFGLTDRSPTGNTHAPFTESVSISFD